MAKAGIKQLGISTQWRSLHLRAISEVTDSGFTSWLAESTIARSSPIAPANRFSRRHVSRGSPTRRMRGLHPPTSREGLGGLKEQRTPGKNGSSQAKDKEFSSLTQSRTPLEPISTCEVLTGLALGLCERVGFPSRQLYRLVGVGLSNFEYGVNSSLLANAPPAVQLTMGLFTKPLDIS